MSIFLAIVAFFMAFGALWFTSEIARRLDLRNQTMNMHNRGSRSGFSVSHHDNIPAESNVTSLDILRGAQRFYPSETLKN